METLRLIRHYRGYKAGAVIQATPQLAATLTAEGVAVPESQQSFFPPNGAERAVVTQPEVQTR